MASRTPKEPLHPVEAAAKLSAYLTALGCPAGDPRQLAGGQGGGAFVDLAYSNGIGIHVRQGKTPFRLEYRQIVDGEPVASFGSMRAVADRVCRRR
jgi:hypothetical protein